LGHGTHVAGIIGAKNNTIGVCGVAAGVPLISVKVIGDNGKGRLSDVIAGLAYTAGLATHKDVVHLSLGSLASIILDSAVIACRNQSGATIVVAAGNESANVAAYSPARIIHTGILVVAAVDPADQFSSFSNFGANRIAYAAPGEMILSTFTDGKYAVMSGTSLAAPHVSGILLSSFKATGSGVALNPPDGALYRIIHR
jgi:subtilisin family serine protease